MSDPSARDIFREQNEAAVRVLTQDLIARSPPPAELVDLPDSMSKDEVTQRRRRLAAWKMEKHNRALTMLIDAEREDGNWGKYEALAQKAKGAVKPPHIQMKNRERAYTLLDRLSAHFYKNLGVRMVVGLGYRDYERPGVIVTTM